MKYKVRKKEQIEKKKEEKKKEEKTFRFEEA